MKSLLLLTACASLASANAADCDTTNLLPLLKDPNVLKCNIDTGFSLPTPPSTDMLPLICASTSCQLVLGTIKALNLGDCTITAMKLETDLIHPIETFCSALTPTTTNKTTRSPGVAGGTAGSSSTTKDTSTSNVAAPAKTALTPMPSPTPASSASNLQSAASVAVVVFVLAVAASVH